MVLVKHIRQSKAPLISVNHEDKCFYLLGNIGKLNDRRCHKIIAKEKHGFVTLLFDNKKDYDLEHERLIKEGYDYYDL